MIRKFMAFSLLVSAFGLFAGCSGHGQDECVNDDISAACSSDDIDSDDGLSGDEN